jgi:hypothetical protein
MGTTLTGTEIKDTYDSLIKVTDNGPISGTAKYLSDGLGNDSALALSTGNIGIGTSSPTVPLQVNGATLIQGTTTSQLLIASNSGAYLSSINTGGTGNGLGYTSGEMYFANANNSIIFNTKTSSGESMRITSAGLVGIGTSSPAAKLDIVGTSGNTQLNITSVSGTFPFITLDQTGVVKYAIQNVATTGLFTITEAGVGDRLVIAKTSGNVGIGNSSPTAKLDVTGTLAVSGTSSLAAINANGGINGFAGATQNLLIDYSASSQVTTLTNTELFFGTNANRRMTITSAGLVGIGTSAPSAELQVNKASDVTLALSNSTAVTSGNRGSLSFYNSAVSTVALIKATAVTDNVGTQLEFYTRPAAGSLAQTMTIDSTGNVGIGTSSPQQKLSVSSTGVSRVLVENTDNQATGAGIQMLVSNAGTGVSNGTIRMDNADNMSFFNLGGERVTINSTGNVGIGTSAPAAYSGYTTLGIDGTNGGVVDLMVGGVRRGSIYNTNSGNTLAIDSITGTNIGFFVNGGERAAVTQNGLTFNGDTAAANALDDYEEGTWTPVLAGAAVGGIYELVNTYAVYTKIGRQVTASMQIQLDSAITGGGSGYAIITGLPYVKMANSQFQGICSFEGVAYSGDIVTMEFTLKRDKFPTKHKQ